MKIKLTRPHGAYRKGEVVDLPDRTARQMIADGLAVEDRQRNLIETASVEQRAETADLNPRKQP